MQSRCHRRQAFGVQHARKPEVSDERRADIRDENVALKCVRTHFPRHQGRTHTLDVAVHDARGLVQVNEPICDLHHLPPRAVRRRSKIKEPATHELLTVRVRVRREVRVEGTVLHPGRDEKYVRG